MVGEGHVEEGEGGRGQGRWSDGRVSGPLTPEFAFFLPRSAAFHNFVKVTLTKSPKKRPSAIKMLTVSLPPLRILPKRAGEEFPRAPRRSLPRGSSHFPEPPWPFQSR